MVSCWNNYWTRYYRDLVYWNRCYLSSYCDQICHIFVIRFGQLSQPNVDVIFKMSWLMFHSGECLTWISMIPEPLYSLELAWIDCLLMNEHELIREIPSMCLQWASLNRPEYVCKYSQDGCRLSPCTLPPTVPSHPLSGV